MIVVDAPYFEDMHVGQVFDDAPEVTITEGHAAVHQALFGDRMRLPLSAPLARAVTGRPTPPVHPMLLSNVAIGQTTYASQHVKANLFYRGLVVRKAVHLGDTVRTATTVAGLRQNAPKAGRPATGLVALEMSVTDQHGDLVLRFWRCPMIPCRDPEADTGRSDSFDAFPAELDLAEVAAAVPGWDLAAFRAAVPGAHFAEVAAQPPGTAYRVRARDTVTGAPELARMTLNMATAHTDAGTSTYGRRLVYGGHTISTACAQVVRALPNLVTIMAWRGCEHTGPVFEGDVLRTDVTVTGALPLPGGGGLVDLRAVVEAERSRDHGADPAGAEDGPVPVLDWRFVALMA